jgi:signal transduction histidine kinase
MPTDPLIAMALFAAGMAVAGLPLGLMIRRLRRHSNAMAEFLASMSHDIRTPMNGVLGFADLLRQQGRLTAAQRASVDHIAESGQTMVRLLNDILDFSKAEAGRLELEHGEIALYDEFAYCTAMFQPRAAEKSLAIRCIVDPEVPLRIVGDPLRLRQVLLNLVGNAVKFTDSGSVDLRVHATRGRLATHLVIEVADTGVGIAPEALGRIFERYQQADCTVARSHGGTGLGLAICRQLVGLMDGRIEVASTQDSGTVFTVHLPVRELASAPPASPRLAAA